MFYEDQMNDIEQLPLNDCVNHILFFTLEQAQQNVY